MSSRSPNTVITPLGTLVAITTTPIQVVAANVTRRAIMFHNPNSGNLILICGTAQLVILPSAYSPVFSGDVVATCAFQANMVTGTGNISILEWQ